VVPPATPSSLEDIPKMAGFLEQNKRWRYRKSLWRLRWGYARRAMFSSALVRGMRRIHVIIWWLLLMAAAAFVANL